MLCNFIGKVGLVAKLANLGLSLAQLSPSSFSNMITLKKGIDQVTGCSQQADHYNDISHHHHQLLKTTSPYI